MTLRPDTRQRLLDLSARFYEAHGSSFDATRGHPWPGWKRLWKLIEPGLATDRALRCLDAGCGNGRFGRFLHEARGNLRYVGVDLDCGLLDSARRELSDLEQVTLRQADLAGGDFDDVVAPASQDLVVLFGVLHHVPDEAVRHDLLRRLARCVAPGGVLTASIWQLDRDPERLARKRIPWAEWNAARAPECRVDVADLDPGDALLGWRGDRETPRYCHFPGQGEVARLADLGEEMELSERFEADGPTGRDNLYLVWRRRPAC